MVTKSHPGNLSHLKCKWEPLARRQEPCEWIFQNCHASVAESFHNALTFVALGAYLHSRYIFSQYETDFARSFLCGGNSGMHIRTTFGETFCLLEGPQDGNPILLVHGGTVPHWVFDRLVSHLHRSGWQTLRLDLYGHGASSRPPTDYSLDFFVEQVDEVLHHFGWTRAVIILGHSLGAVIASSWANSFPDSCARLILAAPMLRFAPNHPVTRLFHLPAVGEFLMRCGVIPLLRVRRRRRFRQIDAESFVNRFEEQLQVPGFDKAILSMFRCGTLHDQESVYRRLNAPSKDVPKLVLWGEMDRVISARDIQQIRACIGRHAFECLPTASHQLFFTHSTQIAASIHRFCFPSTT